MKDAHIGVPSFVHDAGEPGELRGPSDHVVCVLVDPDVDDFDRPAAHGLLALLDNDSVNRLDELRVQAHASGPRRRQGRTERDVPHEGKRFVHPLLPVGQRRRTGFVGAEDRVPRKIVERNWHVTPNRLDVGGTDAWNVAIAGSNRCWTGPLADDRPPAVSGDAGDRPPRAVAAETGARTTGTR